MSFFRVQFLQEQYTESYIIEKWKNCSPNSTPEYSVNTDESIQMRIDNENKYLKTGLFSILMVQTPKNLRSSTGSPLLPCKHN